MSTQSLVATSLARVPGVAIALVLLCAVFSTTSPGFATPAFRTYRKSDGFSGNSLLSIAED